MKQTLFLLSGMALLLGGPALALPVVAVDVDPGTPGAQTEISVGVGAMVGVDIVISGVELGMPLNAFELDLDFVSSIVSAAVATAGSFLLDEVQVIESDFVAPDVNFAATTVGSGAASGSGVLVHLGFVAVGPGSTVLLLNDVLLSQPFGEPLGVEALEGATIHVPEPGLTLLMAQALLAGVFASRRLRQGS